MKGFTRDGKFHPIKPYQKIRKSRDQKAKTQGVRLKHVQRQILNPKGARQKYNQLFWDDLPTITRVLIIGDEIDIETSYLDLPPKQRNQVDSALEQKRLVDDVIQNPNKETMEAFKNKKKRDPEKKWKLYRYNGEEDELVGTFNTKNDAVNHAKWLDQISDQDPSTFSYNHHWKVWSDSPMNEGYQITKGELPKNG